MSQLLAAIALTFVHALWHAAVVDILDEVERSGDFASCFARDLALNISPCRPSYRQRF